MPLWLLKLLPYLAAFALGGAMAELHEHKAPWGLAHQRNDALTKVGTVTSERDGWIKAYAAWRAAEGRCEVARKAENDDRAKDVSTASDVRQRTNSSAWDAGYAAGKVSGRRSCGATSHAPDSPPLAASGGKPSASGVQSHDSADAWGRAAYRPPG